MEFIAVPETQDERLGALASFEEMEAADDIKATCCGG
jgi:hypothetical protein